MTTDLRAALARRRLARLWWLIFPAFTLLTIRLGAERACGQPYDLLPAVTSNPSWAWPLAAVYVLAHGWIVAAYLATAVGAGTLIPSWTRWRTLWGRQGYRVVMMMAALAIEYAPMVWWRWLGAIGLC